MELKNCFAYKNRKCSILKSRKCEGDRCRFYKNQEQHKVDQEKALKRICSLDDNVRKNIIEVYYGGKMDVLRGGI